MKYYNAQVIVKRRGSDNVTTKPEITAAEILLLRSIHGEDAVRNIYQLPEEKEDRTPHDEILDDLRRKYGRNKVIDIDQILDVRPGLKPKLPVSVNELDAIAEYVIDDDVYYAGEAEKAKALKEKQAKLDAATKEESKAPAATKKAPSKKA